MSAMDGAFAQWLSQAQIVDVRLTAEQRGLLQYVFAFREHCGDDYYSNRLLSHFLLHCGSGLKVAQIARLVGISRPTASHQQGVSSKEAIQAAHHRMAGRPHGKLLPRYAGPIAEFILTHADATRHTTFSTSSSVPGACVSRQSLCIIFARSSASIGPRARSHNAPAQRPSRTPAEPRTGETMPPSQPVPLPAPPFSRRGPSMRGRSSCCRKPWTGWPRPSTVSRTRTAPCGRVC